VPKSRRRLLLLVVAVAVLAIGALLVLKDGDQHVTSTSTGITDATDTTADAVPVMPLLGIPGDPPARAALAVKIDNTDNGRPQTGLGQADIVVEEMVEGGLTRLLALFHSQDPDELGPVRSARSTDLTILAELNRPLFAWSGANPTFRAAVEAADLIDVGYSAVPDAYRRVRDRRAPYNLFASPADLRSAVNDDGADTAPPMLFTYRAPSEPLVGTGVRAADRFRASTFATSIEWKWNDQTRLWDRTQNGTPHVDSTGGRVAVPNVVIRTTPYRDSGVRDARGSVVPEAVSVGEGDAWLLSDGKAQPGRWHKPSMDAPTTYTAADGTPLRLTPGQTWVEILPPGAGEVTGGT
jgi:hypothetical protein